jgi:hypothetical protein
VYCRLKTCTNCVQPNSFLHRYKRDKTTYIVANFLNLAVLDAPFVVRIAHGLDRKVKVPLRTLDFARIVCVDRYIDFIGCCVSSAPHIRVAGRRSTGHLCGYKYYERDDENSDVQRRRTIQRLVQSRFFSM